MNSAKHVVAVIIHMVLKLNLYFLSCTPVCMGGSTIFAILSVSVLLTLGIVAAIMQCGMMLYAFGKWGPANEENGMIYFLSDLFIFSRGLAYAWILSVIPSVAIAAIIVRTSISRDRICRNDPVRKSAHLYDQVFDATNFIWFLVFLSNMGLLLISLFDMHHPTGLHFVGVGLFAACSAFLQFWVIYLDYTVDRPTWHPLYVFDGILVLLSFFSLGTFSLGGATVSALSEWFVLILMITIHLFLPIRGSRIVLSKPRGFKNPFHINTRGQILLVDKRPVDKKGNTSDF
jgi:hypothetical protein